MSLDETQYTDRPYNAYFIASVMSISAIAGVFYYLTNDFLQDVVAISEQEREQSAAIGRGYRFDNFRCSYEKYDSDLFLRKVTNNFPPVDESYIPENLVVIPSKYRHPRVGELSVREELIEPITQLLDEARTAGIDIRVNSSFRSHTRQKEIYDLNTDVLLITKPEKAARPGYSEHQLGTAIDMSEYPSNFRRGYDWLAKNAPRYGFVLSYPEGKETITEFRHEPWHWRYVGTDLAKYISENDILFNHEKAVTLPSPIDEKTELPYEYQGRDLWVWKSLGGEGKLEEVIRGDTPVDFDIDIQKLVSRFEKGRVGAEETNIVLPIRSWILESRTSVYRDEQGLEWLRTGYASPLEDEVVERLEVLYREDLGYLLINFQDKDYSERIVSEMASGCGFLFTGEENNQQENTSNT